MAEKGARQFPVSRGKTCAVKTSSAKGGKESLLKGKDGSSSKGGKITFDTSSDSEGSPRATETPVSKGDWGKGGKGDKAGIAGSKSNAPKIPTTPNFEVKAELPNNARCLMDCEAEVILEGIQDQLVVLSEDPNIKVPGSFHKGLQYAKSGHCYTKPQDVRRVLETLKRHNISDGEICLIGNICPENADELSALMPSLKTGNAVKDVLSELTKLKSSV